MIAQIKEYWNPPSKMEIDSYPIGLDNLGNTCFMNVVLQSLYRQQNFMQELQTAFMKLPCDQQNSFKVTYWFLKIYDCLISKIKVSKEDLDVFKQVLSQYNPQFKGYQQQDAQELLDTILSTMHDELNINHIKGIVQKGSSLEEDYILYLSYLDLCQNSVITKYFAGIYLITNSCTACHHTSYQFEYCFHIDIDVPQSQHNKIHGLQELMDSSFIQEEIQGVHCSGCKRTKDMLKTFQAMKLPRLLLLNLKRYRKASKFSAFFTHELVKKNEAPIQLFYTIDMQGIYHESQICRLQQPDILFHLRALINHRGDQNQGHYTCFVNIDKEATQDGWYYFSDLEVKPVQLQNQLKQILENNSEAYLLIYQSQ